MAANLRAVIEELPIGVVVTREGCMLFFNLAATSGLRWSDAKAYLGLELGELYPRHLAKSSWSAGRKAWCCCI